MPITALPEPPIRNDPSTFADRGDALLGALPLFVSQANALEANVNAKEANVNQASAEALAAAGAALAATGAAVWVPGTTYDVGVVRYSPANQQSYRRRTAGAGTTDPSADPTNWRLLSAVPSQTGNAGKYLVTDGEQASWGDTLEFLLLAEISDLQSDVTGLQSDVTGLQSKRLFGSFSMSLTSLGATASTSFTVAVNGAAVGDSVVITPGNNFGNTSTDESRLSYVAWVSAANTITVSIRNASASAANITASTWQVAVIKP